MIFLSSRTCTTSGDILKPSEYVARGSNYLNGADMFASLNRLLQIWFEMEEGSDDDDTGPALAANDDEDDGYASMSSIPTEHHQ